jgi:hypothetical protein
MVVALALGAVTTVMAQQGVELSELSVITATVVAIDRVDRNVTLRGPDGNVVTVEVGYEARNFDQIEIGDQVKVEYYEAVAMYIGKHGQKPDAVAGLVTARAAKGDKPAGVAVEVVDVAATVHAIDKKKRTVTLKGRFQVSRLRSVELRRGTQVSGFRCQGGWRFQVSGKEKNLKAKSL